MPNIVLTTLNARFSHASLGLRYLYANLGKLRDESRLVEFVIGQPTAEIAEQILAQAPRKEGPAGNIRRACIGIRNAAVEAHCHGGTEE